MDGRAHRTRIRTATAIIDASLFQAAEAAAISDNVALKLANVFAWDIDFVLDIRAGDRFTAVYEQIYQDGKYLRDGEVLAAEFINDGRRYRAVRFADGGAAGYYTPEGKLMRKAFLRAPLEFTRVSSVFATNRMHPILNLIRGTWVPITRPRLERPVRAAGDGRVSFEGTRGGYGNAIVLLHSSNVSTLYGHMSRFREKHSHRVACDSRRGHRLRRHDRSRHRPASALRIFDERCAHESANRTPAGAEPLRAESLVKFHEMTAPLLTAVN